MLQHMHVILVDQFESKNAPPESVVSQLQLSTCIFHEQIPWPGGIQLNNIPEKP